jgi:hypothetical protein
VLVQWGCNIVAAFQEGVVGGSMSENCPIAVEESVFALGIGRGCVGVRSTN